MSASAKSKDDIQEHEFLVLNHTEGKGWRRRLRVVSFIINGMERAPIVEARTYRDNDSHPHGRSVGLNFEEAKLIHDRWDEIRECYFGK